jgi:serine/threonine-protein kinase
MGVGSEQEDFGAAMKPEQSIIRLCLACGRSFDGDTDTCPKDGTPLLRQGGVSIEPLDSIYEIQDVRTSRICHTLQLKAKESEQRVIAKVYIPKTDDIREKERFKRIASTLEQLNHPAIPHVLQKGKLRDGRRYVLLEYKPGLSLMDLLSGGKKIDPLTVCQIMIKVCEVLEYAHRKNVIPPDLSPGDIIVQPLRSVKECIWNVSLVDFGKGNPLLHADNRKAQFTELGDFFGTPEFIAPEIVMQMEIDARANIYALGCIMYLALKGQFPFKGATWFSTLALQASGQASPIYPEKEKKSKLQERLQKIVMTCLQKSRNDRYASVSDLRSELQTAAKLS